MKAFESPVFVTRPLLPSLTEYFNLLEEVWEAKWLSNEGQKHQQLEEALKNVLKVNGLSLFNNGTIALMVALQSLELTGEVITTPFTFPATPHALRWNHLTPVFCDIDETTMNINPGLIEKMITPRTSAILGVHVFGTPCDTTAIQEIADKHGLKVIYDAAHAFHTEIDGRGIGSFGDISMFSFHATKLFHSGEGGALTFNDPALKSKIDQLKNFGIKNEEEVTLQGLNGKMNEIQASLGLLMLDYIDEERQKRATLTRTYQNVLRNVNGIYFVELPENVNSSYQYFAIRINEAEFGCSRDQVHRNLKQYNIISRKYFYPLCSHYECYRGLPSSAPNNLPVANRVVRDVLCLPLYGELNVEDVERICETLLSFQNGRTQSREVMIGV